MSDTPEAITCPVCDAPNAGRSLFCAECGAALTGSDGATSPISTTGTVDSQSTAIIRPSRSWSDSTADPQPSATSVAPAASSLTFTPVTESNPYLLPVAVAPESRRGFWLGVVALVLILIVLGLWVWGGILADGTRESVRDFFGMN